jgi:hypothetical protein
MKKILLTFFVLFFISLFTNCAGIIGPTRNITITNNTDIAQELSFVINDTKTEKYTIPANDTLSITVVGSYKVIDNLNFRYLLKYPDENTLEINNATKITFTVINQLDCQNPITLLDRTVEEFSCILTKGESKEVQNWNTDSDYYIEGTTTKNDLNYLEDENIYYSITVNTNTINIKQLIPLE